MSLEYREHSTYYSYYKIDIYVILATRNNDMQMLIEQLTINT